MTQVVIEGTVHVDPADIAKTIQTRAGEDYLAGLQALLQEDVRRIMAMGRFEDVSVEEETAPDGIRLIYHVFEKPLLVGMRFEGNHALKDKKLRQHLKWEKESRVFMDGDRLETYRKSLLAHYEDKAYPRTTIVAELEEQGTPFETVAVFTITEGEKLPLKRLTFEGNSEYSDRNIKKRIKTKASWFLFKRDYTEATMKQDLEIIRNMYLDRGYLDAMVTVEGPLEEEKGLGVTVKIEEGPRYCFGHAGVDGNEIFSNGEILDQISLNEGDFYSEGTFRKDLLNIQNLYRNQGYYFTRIQKDLGKQSEGTIVDATITVREADRLYLGKIEIQGVTKMEDTGEVIHLEKDEFSTKDYVITREIKLKSGEVLDWSKILDADRRLVNLRYFKGRTYPIPDQMNLDPGFSEPLAQPDDPTKADLVLQLEEVRTGQIMFGGSYNTTFGPGAFVEYRKANLFGRGQEIHATVEFGGLRERISLGFKEPYLWGSEYSLDTELYYTNIDSYGGREFQEERIGSQTTFSHPFEEYSRYFFGFRAEQTDVTVFDDRRTEIVSAPDLYDTGEDITTSLILGVARDTRDFYANPTRGTYNRATLEMAGLTDNEFIKLIGESNYYHSLTDKLILALSGEMRLAEPFGGTDYLPLYERFWIGGANTVRGFEDGTLTERDTVVRRRFYAPTGIYEYSREVWLGSEAALIGKAELRYPFFDMLQGVLFLDSGAGYTEIGDIDLGELRFSTGAGVRVNLPFGALVRLDYAIPIKDEPGDQEENFHFSFGQSF
ncbi:MAG: outer membrane protein assembly factor BamA [bacterium]